MILFVYFDSRFLRALHFAVLQSCCWACFFAFAPSTWGSISPLKLKHVSHRAPKPFDWRISTIISFAVVRLRVWTLIQLTLLKSSRIFLLACSLRFLSLFPVKGPQKEPFGLFMCFWMARAPTVKIGGFWFPSNCSSVRTVYNLLNWSISWFFSGGNSSSTLELVRRTPRQVKMPRG